MINRTVYHGRDLKATLNGDSTPKFTIGFEYHPEINILFIAWSKPHNGEPYIRKVGFKTVNTRLDRMSRKNATYADNVPHVVLNNMDNYISMVRRYFKEMPQDVGFRL